MIEAKSRSKSKSSSEKKPVELGDLNKDVFGIIGSKLSGKDIRSMIATSKKLAKKVDDTSLYRNKMKNEFGIKDWKTTYETFEFLMNYDPPNRNYINEKNMLTLTEPYRCLSEREMLEILRKMLEEYKTTNSKVENLSLTVRVLTLVNKCFDIFEIKTNTRGDNLQLFRRIYDKMIETGIAVNNNIDKKTNKKLVDEFKKISDIFVKKIELDPKLKDLIE